jgi:hypothetical protein
MTRAGVTHKYLRRDLSVRRISGMEDQAPDVSSVAQQSISQQSPSSQARRRREGRGAWVLTAYGISGLALFGLLAYFFSDYIAH